MAKKVFKYQLQVVDEQSIRMPVGAEILTVQPQGTMVCIWALVNPDLPDEFRKIFIHGTGHTVTDGQLAYIGTFQMRNGDLVFHVFEPVE